MTRARLTQCYICAMLSVFLLFTGFKGYSGIFDAKCVLFTALSLAYIFLFIAMRGKMKLGLCEICALIYLGITALSAFLSEHFPSTLTGVSRYEGLLTVGIYVITFIFVSQSWQRNALFVPVLSVMMIAEGCVVILQLVGLNPLWLYPSGESYYIALEKYNGAFISTIGNADIASAVFALMTPMLSVLSFRGRYRYLTALSALVCLFCTVAIDVESGVAALCLTAALLLLSLTSRRSRGVYAVAALLVALSAVCFRFIPFSDGTLRELQELLKGNVDPDFGSGRIHIWRETLAKAKPILGSGPDTMLREGLEPFVKTVDGKTVTRSIDIAHNDYLNIFFHQGIFALAAYLGILSCLIKWYKRGADDIFVLAVGAGVFSYCVQVFFSYSSCPSAIFFWIMLGILNSECRVSKLRAL